MPREAGLPRMEMHLDGDRHLFVCSQGVVRTVYPERWSVDLETAEGSLLTDVKVIGPFFPELHEDAVKPAHVGYMHIRGTIHAFCWPLTHRRLLGPTDQLKGEEGQEQPERRYFHLHGYIVRSGDVTVRITHDHRYVVETEQGDYIQVDTQAREVRVHAPTVFIGTEHDSRIEYQRDDKVNVISDQIYLGTLVDDRMEYVKGQHIILQAPLVKVTAEQQIILDPPQIKLGNENATERLILGDLFMALYNGLITLFNTHQHTNVQTGGGLSGPPSSSAASMTAAHLSDIAHVSKDGL